MEVGGGDGDIGGVGSERAAEYVGAWAEWGGWGRGDNCSGEFEAECEGRCC